MKTLNGAPQFDTSEHGVTTGGDIACDDANEHLRAWAESRRCVRCKYYTATQEDGEWCDNLEYDFGTVFGTTFSCAAFKDKT